MELGGWSTAGRIPTHSPAGRTWTCNSSPIRFGPRRKPTCCLREGKRSRKETHTKKENTSPLNNNKKRTTLNGREGRVITGKVYWTTVIVCRITELRVESYVCVCGLPSRFLYSSGDSYYFLVFFLSHRVTRECAYMVFPNIYGWPLINLSVPRTSKSKVDLDYFYNLKWYRCLKIYITQ